MLANAGQDRLLLNDGAGLFVDATAGQVPVDDRRSFGVAVEDVDADRDLDVVLATPSDQNRLLVNDVPFPRMLMSISPANIETGDTVTIVVDALDEDGVASTTLEITPPGGPAQLVPLVGDTATFVPTVTGVHLATASATDTLGNSGSIGQSFEVFPADVTPPTVTVAVDPPVSVLIGGTVQVSAQATDDREVASLSVTVNGTPVPLDSSGNGNYLTTTLGLHTVIATAVDPAGNTATASTSFTVDPDLVAPIVSLSAAPLSVDLPDPEGDGLGGTLAHHLVAAEEHDELLARR